MACAGLLLATAAAGLMFAGEAATPARAKGLEDLLKAGESAESADRFDEAGRLYREAAERFPESARAWASLGEYLRFYGHDFPASRRAFDRVLALPDADPLSRAYALRGLGEIARHEGDTTGAIALLDRSLSAWPLPDTHRSLAHLYGTRGDLRTAAEHARKAVDLNPDDPIALLLCASHEQRAGRLAQGRADFEKALRIARLEPDGSHAQPVHCCVLYNAAGYYGVRDDREGALRMLEAFFKTPNHRHLSFEEVWNDPDFATLRNDPRFERLLKANP
ncbi:MAG: tetratricopeptide repeat protein [Planctomycetota bacterium]|nr:tetratricopeptide repeat protein [Planctomycetota bacterium]